MPQRYEEQGWEEPWEPVESRGKPDLPSGRQVGEVRERHPFISSSKRDS